MISAARRFWTAALLTLSLAAPSAAHAQAAQWNYTQPPGQNSLATYPGDAAIGGNLTLSGSCTGCSSTPVNVPNTWTATQTFQGAAGTLAIVTRNIGEPVSVVATAPPATTNLDVLSQSVTDYTTAATANWTVNIRGNSSTALNTAMAVGQALTVVMISAQGASPFYANAVTIDGVSVTPQWIGGAPTSGNASGSDVYTFTVVKLASASYAVLATQMAYK